MEQFLALRFFGFEHALPNPSFNPVSAKARSRLILR